MNFDSSFTIINKDFSKDSESEQEHHSFSSEESLIEFDESNYFINDFGSAQKKTVYVHITYL